MPNKQSKVVKDYISTNKYGQGAVLNSQSEVSPTDGFMSSSSIIASGGATNKFEVGKK
ncbi:hypothetical protein [Shouchella miscanthi]|uniref:Uncharacterized protein n=1 Tax=Shouchella miscanthi TaxID=2598861 RepID=A0ABU6NPJ3_9BACI|nr:hypothetical protein [Shouchella miscanthi]